MGQNEELKQITEAFKKEHSEQYDLKFLNISKPDLGIIDETFPSLKDKFMLKSKEKMENNLGHRGYQKFYFNVYGYASLKDRQYALKDWMEDFLEGQSIRPGRQMRSYDYASPTIILINDSSIITINYQCSDYTEDNFEYWQDELLKYYGHDNTMVIEVLCGGPLEWTKNAPDPRETRGLF
ncbi:MAG: hypothetical protein U5L96_18690 [Owenweeksia sp.]|nr:hypothetical protein [Owenweeksia sp.]